MTEPAGVPVQVCTCTYRPELITCPAHSQPMTVSALFYRLADMIKSGEMTGAEVVTCAGGGVLRTLTPTGQALIMDATPATPAEHAAAFGG